MATIEYEWITEKFYIGGEYDGEIEDVIHHETFAAAKAYVASSPADKFEIALVCDDWRTRIGERSWAYITEAGTLPENLTDAGGVDCRAVPKRFHAEVSKARI